MFNRTGIVAVAVFLAGSAGWAGAEVLSDPMRPYTPGTKVKRSVGDKPYVLSAIVYSSERRVAVINGQPVAEGHTIDGARVRSIRRGEIELELDGRILKLALLSGKQTR